MTSNLPKTLRSKTPSQNNLGLSICQWKSWNGILLTLSRLASQDWLGVTSLNQKDDNIIIFDNGREFQKLEFNLTQALAENTDLNVSDKLENAVHDFILPQLSQIQNKLKFNRPFRFKLQIDETDYFVTMLNNNCKINIFIKVADSDPTMKFKHKQLLTLRMKSFFDGRPRD